MYFTLVASIVVFATLATASDTPQAAEKRTAIPIPITKRSNLANANKIVDVDALRNHAASIQAKTLRGLEMYERNTGKPHPFEVEGIRKRGQAIALTDLKDIFWAGNVSIGTPDQSFLIDFDTGSTWVLDITTTSLIVQFDHSDLFVTASACKSVNCDGHSRWDPTASSTSKPLSKSFGIKYGDGSNVTGNVYTDTVTLGGFKATEQILGAAMNYSQGFAKKVYDADGLMGLAFERISAFNASSVFHTLATQGKVPSPAFSFKLAENGSELYIGGSNRDLYRGTFTDVPVVQESYWVVELDNIMSGDRSVLDNRYAIIDTGTTFIVGIPADVDELHKGLGALPAPYIGDGFYTYKCDHMPEFSLKFGEKTFQVLPENLSIGVANETSPYCVSAIVGMNTGIKAWTIGDAFLRGVYTRFDLGNDQTGASVGFAELA